jgi:hypothetical protein
MNKKISIAVFILMLVSLACTDWFTRPPQGGWREQATQQSAQLSMQMTQAAANSNYTNAQATAVINDSSDSPQGGVNIYLQGHDDGYEEGVEDVNATNTINRQGNSITFWMLIAGALICMFLGMAFLNAVSK